MAALADDRAFVRYDWRAGHGAEPTLVRPRDNACERRFVAGKRSPAGSTRSSYSLKTSSRLRLSLMRECFR